MNHAWSGPNRVPLREEQMRPFKPIPGLKRKLPLSPRERQALDMFYEGADYKQIAKHMGVAYVTAWQHLTKAIGKVAEQK